MSAVQSGHNTVEYSRKTPTATLLVFTICAQIIISKQNIFLIMRSYILREFRSIDYYSLETNRRGENTKVGLHFSGTPYMATQN